MDATAVFDIRNFTDRLESPSKGRYVCPVCGKDNLTINDGNGAYKCWSECDIKAIRDAIAPLDDKKPRYKKVIPFGGGSKKKARKLPPPPKGKFSLVRSLTPGDNQPQPITYTDAKLGEVTRVEYVYSVTEDGKSNQWVQRLQYPDANKAKGYAKQFYQFHRATAGEEYKGKPCIEGQAVPSKGDRPWNAYRLKEIIAAIESHQDDIAVLLWLEGEKNVWLAVENGLEAITLQGSAWSVDTMVDALNKLSVAKPIIHLFLADNDDVGIKKGEKFLEACAIANQPALVISAGALAKIPVHGDIQELLATMTIEELIDLINEQVQEYVAKYDIDSQNDYDDVEEDVIDLLTLSQQATEQLYGDTPWVCVDKKLYKWNGIFYKHSQDEIEIARIAQWCNNYKVVKKIKNEFGEAVGEKVSYPYAEPAAVRTVFTWIKMRLGGIPDERINPPGLNCINGVLRIKVAKDGATWELVDHSPDIIYLYEPLIKYDPDANTEHCDRLLECLPASQREIFLKTVASALCLRDVRKYKGRLVRILLLNGDGSNGKDALRELTSITFSKEGMTGAGMNDFKSYDDGRKFPLSGLRRSRINWSSENGTAIYLDKLQSLKAFATGDQLDYERKGQDAEQFTPEAIGLFNINGVPSLQGTMTAIKSRYAVLDFPFTYSMNPGEGELQADPRFKYDPEFVIEEVAPAYLNRLLQALVDLMAEGIDYSATDKDMENIQIKNSHLFQFCQDTNLKHGKRTEYLTANDIWEKLKAWYINNGTLIIEEFNGKEKYTWMDQARKGDQNIKAPNQVIARFEQLFPKAKRGAVRGSGSNYTQALYGLSFGSPGGDDSENLTQFEPDLTQSEPDLTQSASEFKNAETQTHKASQRFPSYPSYPSYPVSQDIVEKTENSENDSDQDQKNSLKPDNFSKIGQDGQDGQDNHANTNISADEAAQDLGKISEKLPKIADLEEEALTSLTIAADSDDPGLLDEIRKIYPADTLRQISKKLTPAQHAKILSWVKVATLVKREFRIADRVKIVGGDYLLAHGRVGLIANIYKGNKGEQICDIASQGDAFYGIDLDHLELVEEYNK